MISARGLQFKDWSTNYKLLKKLDLKEFYNVLRQKSVALNISSNLIVAHIDDTLIRKTGKKVFGTSWKRDPLGPKFYTNFVWGQRFLQTSISVPNQTNGKSSKAIPVGFEHCPLPVKPKKNKATAEDWVKYKQAQSENKLSIKGRQAILNLREQLNIDGHTNRVLCMSVDGSYTNSAILKHLPNNTILVGRIRKDTKLFEIPIETDSSGKGRKKVYGNRIPTPEKIRQSDIYQTSIVKAYAAGKIHDFKIKVINNVRWKSSGKMNLKLIIIKPLGYRLNKSAHILYRDPAYLISTHSDTAIESILQAYLWRWEVEVNFRDEKTIMGCGQAQVRTKEMVESVPSFSVATYGLLQLANLIMNYKRNDSVLSRPKWDPPKENQRLSTNELLNLFRYQTWFNHKSINFDGFIEKSHVLKSLQNSINPLFSALFYSRK